MDFLSFYGFMTADIIQLLSKSNRESTCQYGCVAWCARLLPSFRWYSLTDPKWIACWVGVDTWQPRKSSRVASPAPYHTATVYTTF